MGKTLIIAEKPSVANDIAKTLGGFTKHADYFESDQYVLTSAVGHLVEIAAPDQYEVKRGKWSFANLPVIPPQFDLHPISRTETRLNLLGRLIRRKDITGIINACDAGREGELIFRLITQYTKAKQPVRRLWLQSMTPTAIVTAFKHLRSDEEMQPLADAARSRSEADWLIGINGTRAMTAFNSQEGGFFLTTVGRVQTPTLSIVVGREEKIRQFVAREYWEVHAHFGAQKGVYEGRWLDPGFKKNEDDTELRAERIWNRERAIAIVNDCTGKAGTVSEESRPTTSNSPALFDLTSLQREANARFGFSAKNTLAIAQALYERHKVLTYPRTDSRHLPEDYPDMARQTLGSLATYTPYSAFATQILENQWVRPNRRIFDNRKISDHFAIIPTTQLPGNLSDSEQRLYDMVVRRFLAVFYPAAEFQVTTRITEVNGHRFRSEGRVMIKPGWLAVHGKDIALEPGNEKDRVLIPVTPGETVQTKKVELQEHTTRAPARYTEATLLSAMEGAGKLLDDELREAMTGKGLGTPATRAAIIEGLLTEKYLIREGRDLQPTPKAFQLMTLLNGLGINELTRPELTGEWEYKLSLIEKGEISREAFMQEIAQMTQAIVRRAKEYDEETIPGDYATLETPCPKCKKVIRENYRRFACTACDFSISKTPGSRAFAIDEVEELLEKGEIGPLQGFRSKMGRPFNAILKIVPDEKAGYKLEFDFGQPKEDEAEGSEADFSGMEALGPCPKCSHNVFEMPLAYVCEKTVSRPKSCDFRSARIILQREILPEQMKKLLGQGTTDLLAGFVSQRTKRPFKAFLVMGKDGKFEFRFEEKKAASEKKESAAQAAKAKTPAKKAAPRTAVKKTVTKKPATAKKGGSSKKT